MKRVLPGLALLAFVWAAPAAAQTPSSTPVPQPAVSTLGYVGLFGGSASVQKTGGAGGLEVGLHVHKMVDIIIEGAHFQDVVTKNRNDAIAILAGYLQTTQGKPASGSVIAPAWYGGIGARILLPISLPVQPYALVEIGAARITVKPTFILGGADVTATVSQYGVVVGSDISGVYTKPAFTAGAGVTWTKGRFYVDGGFRFTGIKTDGTATNVIRGQVGFGVKF